MTVIVIYGTGVLTSAPRRDLVAARCESVATTYALTPSTRIPDLPPGTVPMTYTVPEGDDDTDSNMPPGSTWPGFTVCYEHGDWAAVDAVTAAIREELAKQGWVRGDFGTFLAVP